MLALLSAAAASVLNANPKSSTMQTVHAVARSDVGKSAHDTTSIALSPPGYSPPPNIGEAVWQGANDLLLPLLFGYALMKLIIQFRPVIIAFLSMVMISLFFLVQMGVVVITADAAVWNELYEAFKNNIIEFGFVKFLAFMAGIWISILRTRRQSDAQALFVRQP